MISTGKLIHQIFMKFHNWFSYVNVAEFQDVNHTAYEMYECPLWVESDHSPILLLKNFSRQNRKSFFTNSVKLGLRSTSYTEDGA